MLLWSVAAGSSRLSDALLGHFPFSLSQGEGLPVCWLSNPAPGALLLPDRPVLPRQHMGDEPFATLVLTKGRGVEPIRERSLAASARSRCAFPCAEIDSNLLAVSACGKVFWQFLSLSKQPIQSQPLHVLVGTLCQPQRCCECSTCLCFR